MRVDSHSTKKIICIFHYPIWRYWLVFTNIIKTCAVLFWFSHFASQGGAYKYNMDCGWAKMLLFHGNLGKKWWMVGGRKKLQRVLFYIYFMFFSLAFTFVPLFEYDNLLVRWRVIKVTSICSYLFASLFNCVDRRVSVYYITWWVVTA